MITIPVTVLTFRRPHCLARTLSSFIRLNRDGLDRFIIRVLVQGGQDEDTMSVLAANAPFLDRVIVTRENRGVSAGWTLLMQDALALNLPYILHLEDDWVSREALVPYLDEILDVMKGNPNIGQIRLRSILETVCVKNPFAGEEIRWKSLSPTSSISVGNAHLTWNPTITRARVIEKLVPSTSEKLAAIRYQALGLKSGQLLARCFAHIGKERAISIVKGKERYLR